MRSERDEPCRQLSLLAAQDLLHRARQVIVAKPAKDPFKVSECQFVRLQKRLLRRTRISPMEGRAAGHRSHRKNLQLNPIAVQIGVRFVPIDLGHYAPVITLRNERLVFGQTQDALAALHILPHRPLRWHPGTSARIRS